MTSKEVATQIKSIRKSLRDIRQTTVSELQILQFEDPKKEKTKRQSERELADAAVDFLMQNLAQFTEEKKGLIAGKENEVLSLVADLQSLIAFLKQATKSYSENEILKHLVKKMTIAVEDAKSAIEELVSASKLQSNKRKKVAVSKVESISERLKDIRRTDAYGLQILQYEEAYSKGLLERKKQSEREMADAAVDFLIQNLIELQQHKAIMSDVKYLLAYLQSLSPILKQAAKSYTGKDFLKDVVKKIRTTVYEAEDTIDEFVIEAKLQHNKRIKTIFDISYYVKVRVVVTQIKSIVERLRGIWRTSANGLQTLQFEEACRRVPVERKAPVVEEDDVVGFDKEAADVKKLLLKASPKLEVIPIVGMVGLGKTTLVNKVFKDIIVKRQFKTRIWVYVSEPYNRKELYLNIFCQLSPDHILYQDMTKVDVPSEVKRLLRHKKYLIVMDDLRTTEAWDEIQIFLPDDRKGSRILLTTQYTMVARYCSPYRHQLKFLTDDKNWELLEKKVFGKDKCPSELEQLGKHIARKCMGLPLATLVVAGALVGSGKTRTEWEQVHQRLTEDISSTHFQITKKLVQKSFDYLPFNLKVCFLYFGVFPRGFEIPAHKLVWLWIAEGFIQIRGDLTLEKIAEEYLDELVDRNLVIVMQRTFDGLIKTCRIYDMLHEFCREVASELNLFQEIKLRVEQSFPRNQELATYRRLCIDSSVVEFIRRQPYGETIRSFLCFCSAKTTMSPSDESLISKVFPLLRVFHAESITFNSFRLIFYQLYHLRYIAFSSDSIKFIPKFIEGLWNLETLVVETQQSTLDIQADICSMPRFRHLHSNSPAKLPSPASLKTSNITDDSTLQTLSAIEPESLTEHVFARSKRLKKLVVRGKVALLLQTNRDVRFLSVEKLKSLENLKLINDGTVGETHLPPENIFPITLKKLTLSGTRLGWNDMETLGKLKALEVLKLKDYAFTGNTWKSTGGSFPCLKFLRIEKTDVVSWKASGTVFPKLERLFLIHCDKLEELPEELASITNLQVMELVNTTRKAAEYALKVQSSASQYDREFVLSITPPYI